MTSQQICQLLRDQYKQPEYAIAFEVGDATGFQCRRHADAIAMSLYPSRGLGIYGFEIKVSRNDLIKELETPEKAESIAQFCNGWYLVYPMDLKDKDLQIPVAWGIIKASDTGLKTVRAAQPFIPKDPTRPFLAALFRGMCKEDESRVAEAVKRRTEEIIKAANANADYHAKRRLEKAEEIEALVLHVLKETGVNLREAAWRKGEIVKAIHGAMHYQEPPVWKIRNLADSLKRMSDELTREIETLSQMETADSISGV
jgi:hypothetical protein